jgi:periplasmic protein TonB
MTAAVARPPLFDHLVASRPERDRHSIGATAASLAMHGSVIAAIIILGARVGAPAPTIRDPFPILPPLPEPVEPPVDELKTGSPSDGGAPGPADPIPQPDPVTFPEGPLPEPAPIHRGIVRPDPTTFIVPTRPVTGPIGRGSGDDRPGSFQPVTELPRLLNRPEIQRTMMRLYPQMLMQAGIGGTTVVWLRLDEEGRVIQTEIKKASGQRAFDDAALEVAKQARFSPALNGDTRVRVWVELPIVFTARD